jgi:hypothetical protein
VLHTSRQIRYIRTKHIKVDYDFVSENSYPQPAIATAGVSSSRKQTQDLGKMAAAAHRLHARPPPFLLLSPADAATPPPPCAAAVVSNGRCDLPASRICRPSFPHNSRWPSRMGSSQAAAADPHHRCNYSPTCGRCCGSSSRLLSLATTNSATPVSQGTTWQSSTF